MTTTRNLVLLAMVAAMVLGAGMATAQESRLNLSGYIYTKWLWGNLRHDG